MSNYAKNIKENTIMHMDMKELEILESLKAGIYTIFEKPKSMFASELYYVPLEVKEELIKFKSGITNDICNSINTFFSEKSKNIYKELKMTHKCGILLYGPLGTGKTCTVQLVMEELVKEHDAICLICTNVKLRETKELVKNIRRVQDNSIILFFDEVDDDIIREEHEFLNFLDGANSVDNLVLIGCTNYLNKIPNRIKNRKSRIKHVFEIKSFPYEVYKEYVLTKLPTLETAILHKFCYLATEKGLTLDQLKHSVLDYKLGDCKDKIEDLVNQVKKDCPVED